MFLSTRSQPKQKEGQSPQESPPDQQVQEQVGVVESDAEEPFYVRIHCCPVREPIKGVQMYTVLQRKLRVINFIKSLSQSHLKAAPCLLFIFELREMSACETTCIAPAQNELFMWGIVRNLNW